LEVRGSGSGLN